MEWKPIGTAPHDGREVLVFGGGSYAVASFDGKEWRDMGDIGWAGMYGDEGNQPTHWMPLSEPPKVGAGETATEGHNSEVSGGGAFQPSA